MFRLPLPDMAIGGTGAAQSTSVNAPKNVQPQENEQSFTNTIFASLDGDKNTSVTKSEAQPQISQGFSFKAIMPGKSNVFMKFAELTGFSDVNQYAKNLYEIGTTKFNNIDSGKIDVAEGENSSQAQQNLDNDVQANIQQQLRNINDEVQKQYVQMMMDAEYQANLEEQQTQQMLGITPEEQGNGPSVIVNNNNPQELAGNWNISQNKAGSDAGIGIRGANVIGKTENGDFIKVGSSGISGSYSNVNFAANQNRVQMGYRTKNFSMNAFYNFNPTEMNTTKPMPNGMQNINKQMNFGIGVNWTFG